MSELPKKFQGLHENDVHRKLLEYTRRYMPIKPRPFRNREYTCELCGSKEVTLYHPTSIHVCPDCVARVHAFEIMKAQGRAKPFPALMSALVGANKCHLCGRSSMVLWDLRFERLCVKCLWYKIGKKPIPMKVEGSYIL